MKRNSRFIFSVILLSTIPSAFGAPGRGIRRLSCEGPIGEIFGRVSRRRGIGPGGFDTSLRTEDKKFLEKAASDKFGQRIQELLGADPAAKKEGLVLIKKRDIPPAGKVFDTETFYIAGTDGKFRGRLYRAGDEDRVLAGLEGFTPVHVADPVLDPKTGKAREYIKFEMKVRREATAAEPFMGKVVDKPGIVMFKDDLERFLKEGPNLAPSEWHRIREATVGISRKAVPVNDPAEVDFLFKSYEDFYRLRKAKDPGAGAPPVNAQVNYVRDAYEYKFARRDDAALKIDGQLYPKEFIVQHTVDRKIRILDSLTGKEVAFPEAVRANEVKSPLEYAKLYLSGKPVDRARLVEMGLQDYVDFMDAFYAAQPMTPPSELRAAGFAFEEGKGKLSTGSRLLESTPESSRK